MNIATLTNLLSYNDTATVKETLENLHLHQLLKALEDLQSEEALPEKLALSSHSLSPDDAQIPGRQVTQEIELLVDEEGSGKVTIGKQNHEKRFVFFFEEARSTGLRKIIVPYRRADVLSSGKNILQKKVKILFVNLRSEQYPLITAPLAIITLGAYLKKVFGTQVEIDYFDMQLEKVRTPIEYVKEIRPDVVGLSVKIGEVEEMYRILQDLNTIQFDRRPMIVLGNVIPTYAADEIYQTFPNVLCVIGRGETAMKALTEHIAANTVATNLFHIPNTSFVIGSTIYQVDGIPFSLAELGTPDWETLFNKYHPSQYQEIWVESSRGCPQKKSGVGCSFCAIMPNNDSRDWVSRPTQAVLEELELLAQFGIKHIRFADEEFMAGQTIQALELARELKQSRENLQAAGLSMPTFDFAIRVDDVYRRGPRQLLMQLDVGQGILMSNNDVRRQALITFKEAGLTQVYLGLESGSFKQLKRMYKAVIPEDNQRAVKILQELGLQIAGGWIMIDPLMEGIEDLKENIAFLEENQLIPHKPEDDFVTNPINRMRVLEGSPFVQIMQKQGLLGPRKQNLIEYAFQYKDQRIALIAQTLDQWEEEVGPWLYALKNKVAIGVLDQQSNVEVEYLGNYLFILKQLDFFLIKELVSLFERYDPNCPSTADIDALIADFKGERKKIIIKLAQDIINGAVEDNAGTLKIGLEQIGISI